MPDINDTVRANIRKERLAQGLSQEALAFKAKLHRAYIGQVERGEKRIETHAGAQVNARVAEAVEVSDGSVRSDRSVGSVRQLGSFLARPSA